MSEATRRARQAALLVRPFNRRLGEWQAAVVRLFAIGERGGVVRAEVWRLLGVVEADAARFEALVATIGAEVAAESRIADTRRALNHVGSRLRALATGPGNGPEPRDGEQV
jgi:hypothetical protein